MKAFKRDSESVLFSNRVYLKVVTSKGGLLISEVFGGWLTSSEATAERPAIFFLRHQKGEGCCGWRLP